MTTDIATITTATALAFVIGWIISARRTSPQQRHNRAIEQFTTTQQLQPGEPTADISHVIIAFDGIQLRHAGTDRQGTDVYVNAEPFPTITAIAVENLPPQAAVVIIGDQP